MKRSGMELSLRGGKAAALPGNGQSLTPIPSEGGKSAEPVRDDSKAVELTPAGPIRDDSKAVGQSPLITQRSLPMNENYAEYLVKRKTPVYVYILNAVMSVITLISIFLALTTGILSVILMFVFGFLTYLSYRNTRVEYEYLFVTGQLSIDKILGKSARKKAFECSMEEIQIIAPSDSYVLNDYKLQNQKTLDLSSKIPGARTYTAMIQSGGNSTKLIFEPNDKMIQCFRQTSPRKVVQ